MLIRCSSTVARPLNVHPLANNATKEPIRSKEQFNQKLKLVRKEVNSFVL